MRGVQFRLFCLTLLVCSSSGSAQKTAYDSQPEIRLATPDRLKYPGWWPTKTTGIRAEFVGPSACAKCHAAEAESWATTPMSHASAPLKNSDVFAGLEPLTYSADPFRYQITNRGPDHVYSVTDGKSTISEPLLWAFGMARKGQTYIYRRGDILYESRLSFYKTIHGLDLTSGQERDRPDNAEDALGRAMDPETAQRCFRCHTTASVTTSGFDPERPFTGVTCEACHGPGARHVAAMENAQIEEGLAAIFNPRKLRPVASVEFCGACHRTWADVLQAAVGGIADVRFQPYRLEESRCWDEGDARLMCITCHDPHANVVTDPSHYDSKCLACHVTAGKKPASDHPGKACTKATKECVSCHMPQVVFPVMHSPFTDHHIRVVRAGQPYPD